MLDKDCLSMRLKLGVSGKMYIDRELAPLAPAAVLVIIHYPGSSSYPHVIFTKRSSQLKSHGGEISFPGGRYSKADESLLMTALRETKEEIGIEFKPQEVLGSMEPVRTLTSRFAIVPFVAMRDRLGPLSVEAGEVEQVLDVPLEEVLAKIEPDPKYGSPSMPAYRFVHQDNIIWGATARIMKQLHGMLV